MAAAAGAAAAAGIVQAIRAAGVVVQVEPREFSRLINRAKDPLIVVAEGWNFGKRYKYLVSYKGLAFFTKSKDPLPLPGSAEVVNAGSIWVPGG
jgi:hypothetical protein